CGEVIEKAPAKVIFGDGMFAHPYTQGLINSVPRLDSTSKRLDVIEGSVPHPLHLPEGCRFEPRCKYATSKCKNEQPQLVSVGLDHEIRCFYPNKEVRSNGE
ncbi:MAG: oligopeptide/dipeptide ABC transporter ATP-binding protein, partial [Bacilli bacterium]